MDIATQSVIGNGNGSVSRKVKGTEKKYVKPILIALARLSNIVLSLYPFRLLDSKVLDVPLSIPQ